MVYSCVHSTEGKGVLPSAHSEETPGAEEKERDLLSTPSCSTASYTSGGAASVPVSQSYYTSKCECLEADINGFNHPPKCFQQVLASVQSSTVGESEHLC